MVHRGKTVMMMILNGHLRQGKALARQNMQAL